MSDKTVKHDLPYSGILIVSVLLLFFVIIYQEKIAVNVDCFRLGGSDAIEYSSIFIYYLYHNNISHLLINSSIIIIVSNSLERQYSFNLVVLIFILTSILSGLFYLLFDAQSITKPTIGASGGAAGLLGAFVVMHKGVFENDSTCFLKAIKTILNSLLFKIFILIWALYQGYYFFNHSNNNSTTTYGTHISGFMIGALLAISYLIVKRFVLTNRSNQL